MATIKSYTSVEQSRKLAEFLPLESADMEYIFLWKDNSPIGNVPFVKDDGEIENSAFDYDYNRILCWSLTALLGVLPEGVIESYYAPNLQKEEGKYSIAYGNEKLLCMADNPVDACYELILKLHELNLL